MSTAEPLPALHPALLAAQHNVSLATDSEKLRALQEAAMRVAPLVANGEVLKPDAVDALCDAAENNGLYRRCRPTDIEHVVGMGLTGVATLLPTLSAKNRIDSGVVTRQGPDNASATEGRDRQNDYQQGGRDYQSHLWVTAEISRLAKLSTIDYEHQRKDAAKSLGARESTLDKLVLAARGGTDEKAGQGKRLTLPEIELWSEPVDGIMLLSELVAAIRLYVVLDDGEAVAVALWVLHCHTFDAFNISPRLAVTSPEKQCGKTTLLDVLSCLVPRPLLTSNTSTSPIFRAVELARPTLLIDEADTFLGNNDELRGILNSGHRKGASVLRNVGDDYEPRMFSTWAPAVIAMIGRLSDTLEDRSIAVRLRRRRSDEKVTRFRLDRIEDLERLARMAARWGADHFEEMSKSDPEVPDALHNRAADNWRPLLAVADRVGGQWSKLAREVAQAAVAASNEQSTRVVLLGDIRAAFQAKGVDRLATEELTEFLIGLEDRPWAEWKAGKPLSKASLSRMLGQRHFRILSGTVRLPSGKTPKGYYLSAFEDAFVRYLPP